MINYKMQRETDIKVLDAIKKHNMIFISAQPDTTYFHWQVSLYLYQFAKHNILEHCYVLFGYTGIKPSVYVQNLIKNNSNIIAYRDTRSKDTKTYIPTIRPFLLKKFFKDRPELGKNVFYHDSDIFLVKLPRFDLMLNDDTLYLSDTVSYIGYEYLKKCGDRYNKKYNNISNTHLFNEMCNIMNIDPNIVINNNNNSGGAQYLLKNIDYTFWNECEILCVKLYKFFNDYEKKYPIDHHVQKWCTDMWCVLWNSWKLGKKTVIHKELDFSWATGTVNDYNRCNIFHLAGITKANKSDKFHKGSYNNTLVFEAYIKNSNIFNHISKNNATYLYCEVIKEYIKNVYIPNRQNKSLKMYNNNNNSRQIITESKNIDTKNITSFTIISKNNYNGLYIIDNDTQCCDKPIWRSRNNRFIIFWNNKNWILTYSKYISEIGPKCGGIGFCSSDFPYDDNWNIEMTIKNNNINRRFVNHL